MVYDIDINNKNQYQFLPWKFICGVPRKFWDDITNHKLYLEWLGKELGYTYMEDWYKLTKKILEDNYGSGLLDKYNSKLFL